MQSIMKELYLGNIEFNSEDHPRNSSFAKAAQKKHDSLEKLLETLNDSEQELLDQFFEAKEYIEEMTRYDTFAAALRFGILLMTEIYSLNGESASE